MLYKHDFEVRDDRLDRDTDRVPIRFTAQLQDAIGCLWPVQVTNVSLQGFLAETDANLAIGSSVSVLAADGRSHPAQVRWTLAGRSGCMFLQEMDWDTLLAMAAGEPAPE